ncbi:MAG: archaeal cell division control protein 6 [Thermoplasmata archaeon]|jgi:cell division control protein 6|nr:archaeal cell division control protein 6 [Thermoplasmata archaeon]
MRDIIAGEMEGPSLFKDAGKLSYDYVPERLPGREEEIAKLARQFRPLLQGGAAQHVLITGPVGSGKTALSRAFCRDLKSVARAQNVNIEFTDVNCRRRSTEGAALLKILTHFDERFPDRGFSNAEMLEILKKRLERAEAHLIVILDEVDILLKKSGSDLIYNLTRFNEESGKAKFSVSLIMVSQQDARTLLDEAAQSTFKRTGTLQLERYDADQLKGIIHQRVDLAFHKHAFPEELEELAADTAAPYGDARYAIELLQKSGQLAEDVGRDHVDPEDIRAAAAESHPFVTETKLMELEKHKAIALLGIARVLKKGGAFATTGEAEERYQLACEELGEKARAHTQFWTFLKDLDSLGFIHTKRSGKGVVGTTTLISLPDIPARVLEEKLVEILRGGA